MNVYRLTMFCAALVSSVACGPDETLDAPETATQTEELHTRRHVLRGRGFVELADGRRVVKVRAVERRNGRVRGRYTVRLTGPDLFFTVDVSCLTVEEDTAWVAGHISDTNADFVELGSVSYFYAIDNGRGPHAPPDIVSTARFNDAEGQDLIFCDEKPLLLEPFEIDGGNIRIR